MKVIFEDNDILVIDKPADLLVHPVNKSPKNTLVNQILSYCPKIKDVGDDSLRPGIVHRLDKDTSGLIIVAKNNSAFEYLKKQFQERKVIKKYLALVIGQVKDKKGTITKAISLSKKDHKKRSALLDNKAKRAWTEYKVLRRFPAKGGFASGEKNYTLLEINPKTGRTHQIRVHLASIGHPIAGDKQYKFKRQSELTGLKRQFLHAAYLKFRLLNGKVIELKSELPRDLWTNLIYLIKNN